MCQICGVRRWTGLLGGAGKRVIGNSIDGNKWRPKLWYQLILVEGNIMGMNFQVTAMGVGNYDGMGGVVKDGDSSGARGEVG